MTQSFRSIGMIGLGRMGGAIAQRLLDCGYSLTVLANRSRDTLDELAARGATEVSTAKELASRSETILLCVDTSASVETRMRGPDGVIAGISDNQLVIDLGTSIPASTIRLAAEVEMVGGEYMDAPLTRTPTEARTGKLNILAGGSQMSMRRARPLLEDLSENLFYVGPLGAGHTLKLINNYYAMVSASAMAEAFVVADRSNINRNTLYAVMAAGPLHSGMMDFVKSHAVDAHGTFGFSIQNAHKDIGYYSELVRQLGIARTASSGAQGLLSSAVEKGWGARLVPELVDFLSAETSSEPQGDRPEPL